MDSNNKTSWWWVRHAPVVGVDGIIYGDSDVECDATDTVTFKSLAKLLPDNAICLTSELSRAKITLNQICNNGLKANEVIAEKKLNEQTFGDWQGYSWSEMETMSPIQYTQFWEDPVRQRPPNGESFFDQMCRVGSAIEFYNKKYVGKNIIAVCHGGTIRAAIAYSLKVSPEVGMAFSISTLSITQLEHITERMLKGKGSNWRVIGINLTAAK